MPDSQAELMRLFSARIEALERSNRLLRRVITCISCLFFAIVAIGASDGDMDQQGGLVSQLDALRGRVEGLEKEVPTEEKGKLKEVVESFSVSRNNGKASVSLHCTTIQSQHSYCDYIHLARDSSKKSAIIHGYLAERSKGVSFRFYDNATNTEYYPTIFDPSYEHASEPKIFPK